jgi:hypothetical protein
VSERVPSGVVQPQGVGEDPTLAYNRLFVRFLQGIFGSFSKGNYSWSIDEALTEITITGEAPIAPELVMKRPAIVVALGPAAYNNIAIDQAAGPLLEKNPKTGERMFTPTYDPATATLRHMDLISSTMTYNCLSREAVEARRLAWICNYFTRTLKRVLMRAGLHRVGEELQVGASSPPGSVVQPDSKEISMVTVSVPFYAQNNWAVAPEDKTQDKTLLNSVELALSSQARQPADLIIRGPGIYGTPLQVEKVISLSTRVKVGSIPSPKPKKL